MKPFAQAALKRNSLNFAGGSHNGGPGRWVIICGVTSTAALPVTGTKYINSQNNYRFCHTKNVKFSTFFFFPIYQIVFSRFAQLPYFFFFPFFFFISCYITISISFLCLNNTILFRFFFFKHLYS